ncbi:MAG: fatty acid desaturase, partial [Deltaproteobacteria bacterium]|nr:fatty acid desaturase [Deltaproteobacteria bacterium]
NRTLAEATEPYDASKTSWTRASLGYYFQIFGGLYLGELMSSALFFLPKALLRRVKDRFIDPKSVSGILMQSWTQDAALREIRQDGALILLCLGLAFYCYGENWPMLLGVSAARGFLISFLDNVYHYRTPIDDVFYAHNLRLPALAAKCLLNFNLHGIHHQNPAIPWHRLPASFAQQREIFHGNYFAAAASQLGGPIAAEKLVRH